ncbi:hypothetical protein F503_08582 [Ophiostoma piceae UAMH 11346]|uniref:Uncharacterized protein n=1 Tax=Ophiostoma piceae (strain UAMH 11346) TaxID=1262450 RepID=S3CNX3_OPHP1|nr:hypothetical protein F503_08582 [Ophiostoma piceae UAMH 11346]
MPPPPYTGRDPLYRPAEGPASLTSATANRIAGRRNDESWVEVASQPSSSSVSSIADEIVITGLRVGSSANGADANNGIPSPQRRRRLLQQVEAATANPDATAVAVPPAPSSLADSSQEEYDETESEEDRAIAAPGPRLASATTENRAAVRLASDGDDEDEEDDDNGTALGVPSIPTFRPQPNAFSHPPTHYHQPAFSEQHQQHRSVPAPPHQHIAPPYARSMTSRSASHRPGRNSAPTFMVPTYREDNDAALRASLSTLLSCAAAARGLPKKDVTDTSTYPGPAGGSEQSPVTAAGLVRPGNQPMGLRFVPESELMGESGNKASSRANDTAGGILPRTRAAPFQRTSSGTSRPKPAETGHHHHSSRNSAVSAVSTSSKTKRSSGATKSSSSPRVTKKKRTSSSIDENGGIAFMSLSPTLLTWVVSAGVVVLVSVVGFGAGFVIGREVGRQEAGSSILDAASVSNAASSAASSNATSCGREIMRSSTGSTLRRFRWGAMTNSVSA